MQAALTTRWPYRQMLHWYFSRHTLDLAAADFETRAYAACARVGLPREPLGV